ncbi:GntR family transcriptional regulator [Leucobacter ruminantium]|uniref:GntR family transcriptional regulator n=1 Tax=Leucobacter ruminantium TaxID=1289170 RepID=A0A939LXW5_9MICO|nr:GntR family transcriptional regulator [Leucobacter ruminantium]MBO1804407.1 GntR family transcriptional regulator [Leucobacter ruminantium]
MEDLDRTGAEPLYTQIVERIRKMIFDGSYVAGAVLPSEQKLQEQYGVARSVVRQALEVLASERLVARHRGRGTTVLPLPRHHRQAGRAGGLSQQIASAGGELRTRIIDLTRQRPTERAVDDLATDDAWRLERLRSVDGEALVHMVTWIPRELFPSLSEKDLEGGSLHDWMRSSGVEPEGGPRQLRAVAATRETAGFLGVPEGTPLTLLEGITRDTRGRVVESFTAWHHPSTVFDLDALAAAPTQLDEQRISELLSELQGLLLRDRGRL